MKVLWHVDDLKVSHFDTFEFTKFVGYLSSIYGGLTVHRGKVYEYLGMELNYIKKVTVKLSMIKDLDSVIQDFTEHLVTTVATLVVDHLFTVRDEGQKQYLPEEQVQTFHCTLAKLLFKSARERYEIYGSEIPHHAREETRQVRLGKNEASVEISQGNEGTETHLQRW